MRKSKSKYEQEYMRTNIRKVPNNKSYFHYSKHIYKKGTYEMKRNHRKMKRKQRKLNMNIASSTGSKRLKDNMNKVYENRDKKNPKNK